MCMKLKIYKTALIHFLYFIPVKVIPVVSYVDRIKKNGSLYIVFLQDGKSFSIVIFISIIKGHKYTFLIKNIVHLFKFFHFISLRVFYVFHMLFKFFFRYYSFSFFSKNIMIHKTGY